MKQVMTSNGFEKILDQGLRNFLEASSNQIAQVLLEIEAPEPVVTFQRNPSSGQVKLIPYAVEFSDDSAETERKAVEETRSLLDSMKINYRFSHSARVFAVDVTPSQLKELIGFAQIRAVIPNRSIEN